MKTVAVQEADANLAELLEAVGRGETVVIERGSRPIAQITPIGDRGESREGDGLTRLVLDLVDEGRRDTNGARFVDRLLTSDRDVADEDDAVRRRRVAAVEALLRYGEKNRGQFEGISIRALIDEGRYT